MTERHVIIFGGLGTLCIVPECTRCTLNVDFLFVSTSSTTPYPSPRLTLALLLSCSPLSSKSNPRVHNPNSTQQPLQPLLPLVLLHSILQSHVCPSRQSSALPFILCTMSLVDLPPYRMRPGILECASRKLE